MAFYGGFITGSVHALMKTVINYAWCCSNQNFVEVKDTQTEKLRIKGKDINWKKVKTFI